MIILLRIIFSENTFFVRTGYSRNDVINLLVFFRSVKFLLLLNKAKLQSPKNEVVDLLEVGECNKAKNELVKFCSSFKFADE